MIVNRAYKFRIYPNAEQEIHLAKTFGSVRFIYNRMLADKIAHYKQTNEKLNNTPAQYKQEFEWLKEVDSLALANAQLNLQTAYNNFFRDKKVGFPKFKSKKNSKLSYTTNNQKGTVVLVGKNVKLPKIGLIKCVQHRIIPEYQKIKSATVTKNPSGKYYVSILVEYEFEPPNKQLDKSKALGLDYASNGFYVDNQNKIANYPRYYRKALDKLGKAQRKLANMKYRSNNYYKQKIKVARLHESISNQRKDWMHNESTNLANLYDYICVEDINMRTMSRCLNLGKSTLDNGFGMFRSFLEYKLVERGKMLIKIDKWFPSSKLCRHCGTINTKLELSDRVWECECGEIINRDENAAINILRQGLSMV